MQPRPMAETSRPERPSLRRCMPLPLVRLATPSTWGVVGASTTDAPANYAAEASGRRARRAAGDLARERTSCRGLGLAQPARLQLAGGVEHRIRGRADMRMDPLQVAQHVDMQGAGLDAL